LFIEDDKILPVVIGLSQKTFLSEEYFGYVGLPYGTDLIL